MPDFSFENKYPYVVAGIDEAGRGPLAGPVMAGAVVFLDKNLPQALLSTLDDSKKLLCYEKFRFLFNYFCFFPEFLKFDSTLMDFYILWLLFLYRFHRH